VNETKSGKRKLKNGLYLKALSYFGGDRLKAKNHVDVLWKRVKLLSELSDGVQGKKTDQTIQT